jgi:predicted nucleotidyltransferase/HEPN domain-containing protein
MKTSIAYLPDHKQAELAQIVHIIRETVPAEMIILFGSYARNTWVEDKYDDEHYRYQSDIDLLVAVETKSEAIQGRFEREIEEVIEKNDAIKTPVSVIVHDGDFINRRLRKAQYFFTDIKKEGVLLYDSEKFQLKEARELLPAERKKLAQEDFAYWFNSAEEFFGNFHFNFEKNQFSVAAFQLHQVAERLFSGILLVFTRYKPNSHDLEILRKLANSVDTRLIPIFPLDTPENKGLFKLLKKAYVDARYKQSYTITHDELSVLANRVEKLREIGQLICTEAMNQFNT